jgi:hypothetical protein
LVEDETNNAHVATAPDLRCTCEADVHALDHLPGPGADLRAVSSPALFECSECSRTIIFKIIINVIKGNV